MRDQDMTKAQFVKEVEKLLHMTRACEGLQLQYGSVKMEYDSDGHIVSCKFTPSERDLNLQSDPREMVRLSWGRQSDLFATYQSIEGDSGIAIISDIMKAVNKMI